MGETRKVNKKHQLPPPSSGCGALGGHVDSSRQSGRLVYADAANREGEVEGGRHARRDGRAMLQVEVRRVRYDVVRHREVEHGHEGDEQDVVRRADDRVDWAEKAHEAAHRGRARRAARAVHGRGLGRLLVHRRELLLQIQGSKLCQSKIQEVGLI